MLSEAGVAVFIKNSNIIIYKKISRVLTVKALLFIVFEDILRPTANKCLINCRKVSYYRPCRVVVSCICMRIIGHD